jgi:hypothetical protein
MLLVLDLDVTRSKGATQIRSSAWLEHYTDNVGVTSSNLVGSTMVAEARVR